MKAIALVSGGLDSILAAKIILEQGIEVVGLNCVTPFSTCSHMPDCNCVARRAGRKLGIELVVIDLAEEFLEILKKPSHGYGSNMNPCIDCKILMLKKAKELMLKLDAKFVVTGEVAGQRPMSQKTPTLRLIEKKSGLEGLLVRPLSAKVLEPTEPEKSGWLNREKLLSISGRGRKDQLLLAQAFGIDDYSAPSGGCLLTYEGYARKVDDLIKHNELTLDNVSLLKMGRHFRISSHFKLIVGRDEKENQGLLDLAKEKDWVFEPSEEIRGPVALGRGEPQAERDLELCSQILGRYCDNGYEQLNINVRRRLADFKKTVSCPAFKDDEIAPFRIK